MKTYRLIYNLHYLLINSKLSSFLRTALQIYLSGIVSKALKDAYRIVISVVGWSKRRVCPPNKGGGWGRFPYHKNINNQLKNLSFFGR